MESRSCRDVQGLNRAQRESLSRHLDVHKWLMSERAGRDVGMAVAKADFMAKHFDRVCHELRISHCGEICQHRDDCAARIGVERIPSVEQRLQRRNLSN